DADGVRLRHAQHYAEVAIFARNLYRPGGVSLLPGLALFDRERAQIDTGWNWARVRAGTSDADVLLLEYSNGTAYIGDLRYNTRRERIPQFEATLAAAQRLNDRGAEGIALNNLGLTYADLGEPRQAIALYERALPIFREIGDRMMEGRTLNNLGLAYLYND